MPNTTLPGWLRVRGRVRTPQATDGDVVAPVNGQQPDLAPTPGPAGAVEADVPVEAAVAPEPVDQEAKRFERRLVAILITVGFVVFAVAIRLRMLHGYPAGDEPAYLVLSQTM